MTGREACSYLQYTHFIALLPLLLATEPQQVYDLNGHLRASVASPALVHGANNSTDVLLVTVCTTSILHRRMVHTKSYWFVLDEWLYKKLLHVFGRPLRICDMLCPSWRFS